ncbi:MAG TPA: hypothetical protein VK862_03650 [Afifellaceae bacterium]|nr:hypothetical protein [Afifellaceae bacterium]
MVRKTLTELATLSVAVLVVSACRAGDAPVSYPAANLAADSYEPGPGWRLVWSDEFEG